MNTSSITTRDRVEALCLRYLCWAKVKAELVEENGETVPVFTLTGKGVEEAAHKIRVAHDTYMGGLSMEQGLKELDRHLQKLKGGAV